ncbi:N-acetylmuramoyl-L-alanine amidase [Paludicola sp. MB14-C6]|uniref:N-acetylmuramoyl-L-alanine amidase family protein n=1 Tax=Paludihabitans sp. MB14-C6 TaxID=3070656 RepID=UPI0027DD8D9C|nr:N-acetylmuramoyl-L-alanine amidase [Paludicola sp. MB14-C6]WMJ24219.1 N-acetylmuramoyl-L-alanine amidase [Paludicola sp. MB14-C6]
MKIYKANSLAQNKPAPITQSQKKTVSAVKTSNAPLSGKRIVVDAGHGGKDPGTISPNNKTYEANLNLMIAYKLKDALEKMGVEVIMTRTKEITQKLGTNTKLELENRGNMIEKANADMVLSVHQNFNEDNSQISGVQIICRTEQSVALADFLQKAFNKELNKRLNYIKDKYILLAYGQQPSVIVECGFLSNPQEEQLLTTDKYQQRLIDILIKQVKLYFQQDNIT